MDTYFVCVQCGKVIPKHQTDHHYNIRLGSMGCDPFWMYEKEDDDGPKWENIIEIVIDRSFCKEN